MKVLIGVLILVTLTIILSFYGYNLIVHYTDNLVGYFDDLEKAVKNGDWSQAKITKKKMNSYWFETKKFLPAVIDHGELHDVEIFIARISTLIELKEQEKVLIEISGAKEILNHIPIQEKLTIRNIL